MKDTKTPVFGDCEASHIDGGGINVKITLAHHNMWLCADCLEKEKEAIERSKKVTQIVDDSRKVDDAIELRQDIYNSTTVSFVELQAAIAHNDMIPVSQKEYALAKECADRIDKLTAVIFAEEAATMVRRQERHAWLQNMQNQAAKLRLEHRNEFKQYDINYNPKSPTKKEKTTKPTKGGKTPFDKTALYAAAKKYGVPAAQVQALIVSRNMSAEDAAKHLAELLGKL